MADWRVAERGGWGDHIEYFGNWQFTGHTTPRPRVGDYIITPCDNGCDAALLITTVRKPLDPPDQWFADVKPKDLSTEASKMARDY